MLSTDLIIKTCNIMVHYGKNKLICSPRVNLAVHLVKKTSVASKWARGKKRNGTLILLRRMSVTPGDTWRDAKVKELLSGGSTGITSEREGEYVCDRYSKNKSV
jgi:hypothetical protein